MSVIDMFDSIHELMKSDKEVMTLVDDVFILVDDNKGSKSKNTSGDNVYVVKIDVPNTISDNGIVTIKGKRHNSGYNMDEVVKNFSSYFALSGDRCSSIPCEIMKNGQRVNSNILLSDLRRYQYVKENQLTDEEKLNSLAQKIDELEVKLVEYKNEYNSLLSKKIFTRQDDKIDEIISTIDIDQSVFDAQFV